MKNTLCISILVALSALLFLSCEGPTNVVQNSISPEKGLSALSKAAGADKVPPTIGLIEIRDQAGDLIVENHSVPLPQEGKAAIIHYRVHDDVAIRAVTIDILFDDDKDNYWDMMYTPRLFRVEKTYDGTQKEIDDTFKWDGTVFSEYSSDGKVFDQFASDPNPDIYLVSLDVSDGQNHAQNWVDDNPADMKIGVADNSRILVDPQIVRAEFHIRTITTNKVTPNTRKGRNAAEISATIGCNEAGFSVMGNWYSLSADGVWKPFGYWSVYNAGSNNTVTIPGRLVGPGTYRFYPKLLYNPTHSYKPQANEKEFGEVVVQ